MKIIREGRLAEAVFAANLWVVVPEALLSGRLLATH
jgi:hypothetical protein